MDLLKIYPAGPVKLAGLEYPHTHNSSDQGLLTLPTLGSTENMEMDSHLLLDALTLSAVAILLITLLVAKLVKKQKKLAATTSSATQTTVWDTDVEKALSKMNEEMEVFHARLERMEQARLESINHRRLSVNPESQTKEDGAPASEQWSGASPSYPPY